MDPRGSNMADADAGTTQLEDPSARADTDADQGPVGLTLRQAALVYFGGLLIVVAALVTFGFAT
ncbi:hypothetical protein [Salipiger sp. PrR007]|uniref:hypothetical protein n=1 Tax=Salipiger sp. PrR007 TaxID=2706884 RepID=UPI0013BC3E30|nr:hypothetical protein [Salipiger sp. PrR007]NDW34681.1 hypothetical protein [Salipiger sp. PrR007]